MRISDWSSDVCSSDLFGLFPMLKRYKDFKHDWEPAMLEGSHDLVFRNSFKYIRYALETLNGTGTRYEFECRSEERRVGKECAVRVDLGGRRIIKKKK